ncbi:GtrA family protein [Hyphococcus sp. DH-69]|uniref:GtrA family protein n=1 Tax=Hyphococcus formosus TaxID=3143534 RepID=UPI00398B80A7
MTNHLGHQIARFFATGAANTIVGLIAIYALMAVGVHYAISNAIGYAIGLSISFFLNRSWTFGINGKIGIEAFHFLILAAVAYAINLSVVALAVEGLGASAYLAQLFGVVSYSVVSFLGMKYLVFVKRGR